VPPPVVSIVHRRVLNGKAHTPYVLKFQRLKDHFILSFASGRQVCRYRFAGDLALEAIRGSPPIAEFTSMNSSSFVINAMPLMALSKMCGNFHSSLFRRASSAPARAPHEALKWQSETGVSTGVRQ
jgi:hypothetical protein